MNVLVTAGNTQAPLDEVRCITNIFTGRTGAAIAREACRRGHRVTLITSHPETAQTSALRPDAHGAEPSDGRGVRVLAYRTFDDLRARMESAFAADRFDAVVHCAAVSDYQLAGAYAAAEDETFGPGRASPHGNPGGARLVDAAAGKIKSCHRELWLRLVPTPKLVDLIRSAWGHRGVLVKFKLEVGVDDDELLRIAKRSRRQSAADLLVANTLEERHDWAWLVEGGRRPRRLERAELPRILLDSVERLHRPLRQAESLAGASPQCRALAASPRRRMAAALAETHFRQHEGP